MGYALQACNTIAEHRTYPIIFKEWQLCIPPPQKESYQSMATQQYEEYFFKVYWEGNKQTLDLFDMDELTVNAIAKATMSDSPFKELFLLQSRQLQ